MGKFEHGFGTQLGAVLLWRGIPSASMMLAWSHQTRAAGDRKREIFSRNWVLFCCGEGSLLQA